MDQLALSRRAFLRNAGAALGTLSMAGFPAVSQTPSRPKNLICFLCDDIGAQELGCYGNTAHQTPHLDALAKSGVRFETFYATPVCSPTRVCLMTGRYGFRTGWCNMRGWHTGVPADDADLARDEQNFAELLRPLGYTTGFAGKWQLTGDHLKTMLPDAGFQESLMWIYKNYLASGEPYKGGYFPPDGTKTSRYWHPGLARDGVHFVTTADDYGPDMFRDFSLEFIRKHKSEPFFLYYPMVLTHQPWVRTPDTPDLEGHGKPQHLKANVEYADKIVGAIVQELDALGIREDTIVMFVGDNGTQGRGKATPTEWGARVPFIVNCPGTVQSGVVSGELSDISDVVPTLVEFAGGAMPEGTPLDGKSLVPYLTGRAEHHRDWVFSFLGQYRILRDKQWLLEQNSPDDFGQMFYCGESRDGTGYKEVTQSDDPEVLGARKRFEEILANLPSPESTAEDRYLFARQTNKKMEGLNDYLRDLKDVVPRKLPAMPPGVDSASADRRAANRSSEDDE